MPFLFFALHAPKNAMSVDLARTAKFRCYYSPFHRTLTLISKKLEYFEYFKNDDLILAVFNPVSEMPQKYAPKILI